MMRFIDELVFSILYFWVIVDIILEERANGLRYLRWGGDGEAVQPEKWKGVENCLRFAQNPQRQVHALLARTGASTYAA